MMIAKYEIAVFPAVQALNDKRVVLASTSPRRIEILTKMGFKFESIASGFGEDYDKDKFSTPQAYSAATCLKKGAAVLERLQGESVPPSLVISADTIVVCEGVIYEKATDRSHAKQMLQTISGKTLQIVTAVAFHYRDAAGEYQKYSFEDVTEVFLEPYDDQMIDVYLSTGDGMDHSAALACQTNAFLLIKEIRGCYYSMLGFPGPKFYQILSKVYKNIH